jgi:hypothetical protein
MEFHSNNDLGHFFDCPMQPQGQGMASYRKYPLGCIHRFELGANLGFPSNMAMIFILGYC